MATRLAVAILLIRAALLTAAHAGEEPTMQTYQDQLDFFNQHWPALKAAAGQDGP